MTVRSAGPGPLGQADEAQASSLTIYKDVSATFSKIPFGLVVYFHYLNY